MLTPTDIHYLVGLLAVASTPDSGEIEFGSLVMDEASESGQDMDIIITRKNLHDERIQVWLGAAFWLIAVARPDAERPRSRDANVAALNALALINIAEVFIINFPIP